MVEENIQEWEKSFNERVSNLLAQRVNPLNTELERLEQTLATLRGNLAVTVSDEEQAALAMQLRVMVSEAVAQTEERAEKRLTEEIEKARATITANLRQTLEEDFEHRLAQAKAETEAVSQTEIAQLQAQLASAAEGVAAAAPASTNNYPAFKAAVEDIDAQRTQSETLTALIRGAAQFAPRIAFFVVKGGDVVGWKATGFQNGLSDETVRSLTTSTQTPSLLSQALSTQTTTIALSPPASEILTILGNYADLTPQGAVAVPLVVRGKAAAVLYADSGESSDDAIQLEALETLIHIASMGIELLPSRRNAEAARPAPAPAPQAAAPAPAAMPPTVEAPVPVIPPTPQPEPPAPTPVPVPQVPPVAPSSAPAPAFDSPSMPFLANPALVPTDYLKAEQTPPAPAVSEIAPQPIEQPAPEPEPVTPSPVYAEAAAPAVEEEPVYPPHVYETNIGLPDDDDDDGAVTNPFTNPLTGESSNTPPYPPTNALDAPTWMRRLESPSLVNVPEPNAPLPPMQKPSLANWGAKERPAEKAPSFQAESPSVKLADKIPNFNTPSEPPRYAAPSLSVSTAASETEVRAHNDARRFARLLVSEIKLYNAAKVNEGRRNGDLYERLRDEVDRSRKVYDKRVSPTVAAKFDYFYDELVQTLAEGDPSKLGESCPGPFVVAS